MKPSIAIIGAGNIGSRHLQSLSKLKRSINVWVYDPNPASLELSEKRLKESESDFENHRYTFISDFKLLPSELDFAVISTNSINRRDAVFGLIQISKVKNLILEKFLFTRISDYADVNNLLKNKKVNTWVDCSQRYWPIFAEIKKDISGSESFNYLVQGSRWNMASNVIHFADLLEYLTDKKLGNLIFQNKCLINKKFQSKRDGYIELYGSISFIEPECNISGIFSSSETGNSPLEISISSEKYKYIIDEVSGKGLAASAENNWQYKEFEFEICYQSGLTNLIIEDIINTGNCLLPTYEDSMRLHLQLFKTFLEHIKIVYGENVEECMIS